MTTEERLDRIEAAIEHQINIDVNIKETLKLLNVRITALRGAIDTLDKLRQEQGRECQEQGRECQRRHECSKQDS